VFVHVCACCACIRFEMSQDTTCQPGSNYFLVKTNPKHSQTPPILFLEFEVYSWYATRHSLRNLRHALSIVFRCGKRSCNVCCAHHEYL